MDSFYTPTDLATYVLSCYKGKPKNVADFAAGDGALLRAAIARWPSARVTAFDLDGSAIAALASTFPNAVLSRSDFLACSGPDSCGGKPVDLIVLNPPFSVRGNTTIRVNYDDQEYTMSRAMAFVTNALKWLSSNGELIAIVPSSCLTSQRDKAIREHLASSWKIERKRKDVAGAFLHCEVSVDVIHIRRDTFHVKKPAVRKARGRSRLYSATLMRGSCPNARAAKAGKYRLIHTTDLRGSTLQSGGAFIAAHSRKLKGKAVLMPRVGRPSASKIAVKSSQDTVVLSDCVFALQTSPRGFEYELAQLLRTKWKKLEALYTGSCARYLTMDLLQEFLESEGVNISRVGGATESKGSYSSVAKPTISVPSSVAFLQ
jgi:methylase of polypeptide subunit release factors